MKLIDPLPGKYDSLDPFGHVRPSGKKHLGSDWIVSSGTEVPAMGSGKVAAKGYTSYNGTYVTVLLPDGHYYAYIHLQDVLVDVGDTVTIGQIIAHSDQSGSNANIPGLGGPHLHVTVSGSPAAADGIEPLIDPWEFIQTHINDTDPVITPEKEDEYVTVFYATSTYQLIYQGWRYLQLPDGSLRPFAGLEWQAYAAAHPDVIVVNWAGSDLYNQLVVNYGLAEFTGNINTGPGRLTGKMIFGATAADRWYPKVSIG